MSDITKADSSWKNNKTRNNHWNCSHPTRTGKLLVPSTPPHNRTTPTDPRYALHRPLNPSRHPRRPRQDALLAPAHLRHPRRLVDNRRHDLGGRAPVPDHHHVLALDPDLGVPLRRVHDRPGEGGGVEGRVVGDPKPAEAGEEEVARPVPGLAGGEVGQGEVPQAGGAREARFGGHGQEANIVQVVFVLYLLEVCASQGEDVKLRQGG